MLMRGVPFLKDMNVVVGCLMMMICITNISNHDVKWAIGTHADLGVVSVEQRMSPLLSLIFFFFF